MMNRRTFKTLLASLSLGLTLSLLGTSAQAYDETADAKADIERASAAAKASGRKVLVVFGANWCPDCRALESALKVERNAQLIAKEFTVVKVDVGRFDKNKDIAERFGNPIKKGIPAAVIATPDGKLLYATRAGELANARQMSETGVYDFFHAALAQAAKPQE